MESIPDIDINICHTVIFINHVWHRSGPLLASEKRIQITLGDPHAPPQPVHDQFVLGDPAAHLAFGDLQVLGDLRNRVEVGDFTMLGFGQHTSLPSSGARRRAEHHRRAGRVGTTVCGEGHGGWML